VPPGHSTFLLAVAVLIGIAFHLGSAVVPRVLDYGHGELCGPNRQHADKIRYGDHTPPTARSIFLIRRYKVRQSSGTAMT
jgi:hypothetical protein